MKLLPLLLCLLLCGCSAEAPETDSEVPNAAETSVTETSPVSMYDAENPLETQYQGGLKVYPLTMRKVRGIRALDDSLLAFSGYGSTTLTLLTGDGLTITAQTTLDFDLSPDDASVQLGNGTISYYDPVQQASIVMNERLKEIRRIPVDEAITGSPILSSDRNTLYYCTAEAILAWNLETGIHRTIKELSYEVQELTGLHWNDTVLQCRIQDGETLETIFLSTETGQILSQQNGDVFLTTEGEQYYAALPVSSLEMLVFGSASDSPRVLYPEDLAATNFYLPHNHAVITASITADQCTTLRFYELGTGIRRAELSLDLLQMPKAIVSGSNGVIYILVYDPASDQDTIYRWNVTAEVFSANADCTAVYTDSYSGEDSGNPAALAQCQAYAAQLSEKYGIQILVWEDALKTQPWDYEFQAETLPRVLLQELDLLDQRLGQYPQAVLNKTASHFSSLSICLVREITGTAAQGSLNTATGVQYLDGTDAYVAISVGKYSEQALYHELYHVMETHILNESSALDLWSDLNPKDFSYTYDYSTPESAQAYLESGSQAFVDIYAMSFPKEDRARTLEKAMLPGNSQLFQSEILQAKLTALCEGIRQAYGLRKSEETFLWEQYLTTPLAYGK